MTLHAATAVRPIIGLAIKKPRRQNDGVVIICGLDRKRSQTPIILYIAENRQKTQFPKNLPNRPEVRLILE